MSLWGRWGGVGGTRQPPGAGSRRSSPLSKGEQQRAGALAVLPLIAFESPDPCPCPCPCPLAGAG